MDYSFRVASTFSRLSHVNSDDPDDAYTTGAVVTTLGVVLVYSQAGPGGRQPHTSLSFLHEGRMYQRGIKRFYSALGLARVAAAFAREIAGRA